MPPLILVTAGNPCLVQPEQQQGCLGSATLFGRPLWAKAAQAERGGARGLCCLMRLSLCPSPWSYGGAAVAGEVRTLPSTGFGTKDKEDSNSG